jgi:hypothetical protein
MSPTATLIGYLVIASAGVGYELAGWIWRRTPRLGEALSMLTRSRAGRCLLLAGWLWLGWHLFVRASWG